MQTEYRLESKMQKGYRFQSIIEGKFRLIRIKKETTCQMETTYKLTDLFVLYQKFC